MHDTGCCVSGCWFLLRPPFFFLVAVFALKIARPAPQFSAIIFFVRFLFFGCAAATLFSRASELLIF